MTEFLIAIIREIVVRYLVFILFMLLVFKKDSLALFGLRKNKIADSEIKKGPFYMADVLMWKKISVKNRIIVLKIIASLYLILMIPGVYNISVDLYQMIFKKESGVIISGMCVLDDVDKHGNYYICDKERVTDHTFLKFYDFPVKEKVYHIKYLKNSKIVLSVRG